MLYTMKKVKDGLDRIDGLDAGFKTNEDKKVEDMKKRVISNVSDIIMLMTETKLLLSNSSLRNDLTRMISALVSIYNDMLKCETALQLKALIVDIQTVFERFDFFAPGTHGFNSFGSRLYNAYHDSKNRSLGGFQFENGIYTYLSKIIDSNYEDITMFSPYCEMASGLEGLNINGIPVKVYSNEPNATHLRVAKTNIYKCVKGPLRGSKIQNNAFDILHLFPNIDIDGNISVENYIKGRTEKEYIRENLKYLREDGVAIIVMPFTRLFKDTCAMLAKNLRNVQVFRTLAEFGCSGLVVILGQRKIEKQKTLDTDVYATLRRCSKVCNTMGKLPKDSIKEITDVVKYKLPTKRIPITLFKGSQLDMDELEQLVDTSSAIGSLFDMQKVEKLSDQKKEPLLPFNIGQIGVILTSGCLDGEVDEGDGIVHMIKGKVSKDTKVTETVNSKNEIEVNEAFLNKVEIVLLNSNGDIKTLS